MNDLIENATLLMMTEASYWRERLQDDDGALSLAALQSKTANSEDGVPLFI